MEVLSSRVLLAPSDFEAARRWYTETLGLRVAREYGPEGRVTGVVLFCGGGFVELTSAGDGRPARHPSASLWLQVPDVAAEHTRLVATGDVRVTAPPERKPWGLVELWIADPDGVPIVLVEVPEGHPLRRRLGIAPG